MVQRPDECVTLAIFRSCHWGFGFKDRVDTADWICIRKKPHTKNPAQNLLRTSMGDFSSNLKEDMVLHLPWCALSVFARHLGQGHTGCILERGSRVAVSPADWVWSQWLRVKEIFKY